MKMFGCVEPHLWTFWKEYEIISDKLENQDSVLVLDVLGETWLLGDLKVN